MIVLGIESSCDETAVAIYDEHQGLVAHCLHSQIQTHQRYGGVVPELASRDHVYHMLPLVEEALDKAGVVKHALDAVAYTAGPGLIGALLVGASFAKSFAYALSVPAIAVHHLEGHLLAAMLDDATIQFPFLTLLVSGGHTQFIHARALGDYILLGETLDDAVGEAFDKTAKCMGLPYPGGPRIASLADAWSSDMDAIPAFPRPMLDRPNLMLSFSGLKTHEAVVDVFRSKCKRALQETGLARLVVAGGVGANRALREALLELGKNLKVNVSFPRSEFCTDNGAMIAYTGFLHLKAGRRDDDLSIVAKARWPFTS
jgi:N6-L-threonylcarbamoyladenine synthase